MSERRPRLFQLSQAEAMAQVRGALDRLRANQPDEACRAMQALVAREPDFPPAREVLACALQVGGDLAGAEREIREALALDPLDAAFSAGLGEVLWLQGRLAEAEHAYRAALSIDPRSRRSAEALARLLLSQQRVNEADSLLRPLSAEANAPPGLLGLHAAALEALGDVQAAQAPARKRVEASPDDADGWVVLARLLQAQGRLDEAEQGLRTAVSLQPNHREAHLVLADLLWMSTGDRQRTLAPLDHALARLRTLSLLGLKVKLMGRLGAAEAAWELAAEAVATDPGVAGLQAIAATAAAAADRGQDMLRHAEALRRLRPDEPRSQRLLAEACVRTGAFGRALPLLDARLREDPYDQQAIAIRALAWRCTGDPRYGEVYDYPRLVRTYGIETPPGWDDLAHYLSDLAEALKALHRFDLHPLDQSLRGGTQTSHNLALSREPAILPFFAAIDRPIRDYVEALGPGEDPLRARRQVRRRVAGAWSVNLRPNGFHVSHVHPEGWLSSAFYVETPQAISQPDRAGWLQFGEPGIVMAGQPQADYFVRPEPGTLVLFPSYMFHGTRPFGGFESRLTIAFDVVPA